MQGDRDFEVSDKESRQVATQMDSGLTLRPLSLLLKAGVHISFETEDDDKKLYAVIYVTQNCIPQPFNEILLSISRMSCLTWRLEQHQYPLNSCAAALHVI